MKHWFVPGVTTEHPSTLPRRKNLSRETEHLYGTSQRDPLSLAYNSIKDLSSSPQLLQRYLRDHVFRLIFLKLNKSSIPRYEKLSHNERLDLALTEGIINDSLRSLVFQIETESNSQVLLSVFLNFLKQFQSSPLEFQPLFRQLAEDKEIFSENEEIIDLNRQVFRVL